MAIPKWNNVGQANAGGAASLLQNAISGVGRSVDDLADLGSELRGSFEASDVSNFLADLQGAQTEDALNTVRQDITGSGLSSGAIENLLTQANLREKGIFDEGSSRHELDESLYDFGRKKLTNQRADVKRQTRLDTFKVIDDISTDFFNQDKTSFKKALDTRLDTAGLYGKERTEAEQYAERQYGLARELTDTQKQELAVDSQQLQVLKAQQDRVNQGIEQALRADENMPSYEASAEFLDSFAKDLPEDTKLEMLKVGSAALLKDPHMRPAELKDTILKGIAGTEGFGFFTSFGDLETSAAEEAAEKMKEQLGGQGNNMIRFYAKLNERQAKNLANSPYQQALNKYNTKQKSFELQSLIQSAKAAGKNTSAYGDVVKKVQQQLSVGENKKVTTAEAAKVVDNLVARVDNNVSTNPDVPTGSDNDVLMALKQFHPDKSHKGRLDDFNTQLMVDFLYNKK